MHTREAHGTDGARSAALVAAFGLVLFLVYVVVVDRLGWLSLPLAPLGVIFGGLALVNLVLAATASVWCVQRWVAWVYEGLHAVVLTAVLYLCGGTGMGIYLMVYGFLVVHTEVLQPNATPFVTATICSLCYATLAWLEHGGYVVPTAVLTHTPTLGTRLVFVTFATASLHFLALYAHRHGKRWRDLATRLEAMVVERTRQIEGARRSLEAHSRGLEASGLQLEESYRTLQQVTAELRTFVYSVTHDLKNPVNAILLTADRLLQRGVETLGPKGRADVEWIRRTSARTENMLRDLLEMFRVTSAHEPAGTIDVKALVDETLETMRPQLLARGVRFEVGPLPAVWGRGRKLEHVFANLLGNAVRHVPQNEGEIRVFGHRDDGRVVLTVQDNGIGIPAAYHEKIFQVFTQVPRAPDETPPGGTGIGLAMVKRIVEDHGGHIHVESEPGYGARFVIDLPVSA